MFRYAARNALLPSVTAFGMALGFVVGGALLTEVVFAYPGIGYQLLIGGAEPRLPADAGPLPDDHGGGAGRQLPRRHRLRPARPARARPLNGARMSLAQIPSRPPSSISARAGPTADPGRTAAAPQARRRTGSSGALIGNRKAVAGLVILALFAAGRVCSRPSSRPGDPVAHHSHGHPAALGRALARHHRQGTGRARPDHLGRAQLALRRLHRRARGDRWSASLVGLAAAYLRPLRRRRRCRWSPTSSCCCPACRCSSSWPRSCRPGPRHRHPGARRHRLGRARPACCARRRCRSGARTSSAAAQSSPASARCGSCSARSCPTWRPSS